VLLLLFVVALKLLSARTAGRGRGRVGIPLLITPIHVIIVEYVTTQLLLMNSTTSRLQDRVLTTEFIA
jgi:hypothetical protein